MSRLIVCTNTYQAHACFTLRAKVHRHCSYLYYYMAMSPVVGKSLSAC